MPTRVGRPHQLDEIGARAEARIHVEEVLHAVPVEVVALHPLSEHGGNPERGDPEIRQVRKLALDAGERAALKSTFARLLPPVPAPRGEAVGLRVRRASSGELGVRSSRGRVCSWPSENRSGSRKYSTSSRQSCRRGMRGITLGEVGARGPDVPRRCSLQDLCDVVHAPRLPVSSSTAGRRLTVCALDLLRDGSTAHA